MGRSKRSRIATIVVAALGCSAAALTFAQSTASQPGSLAGRLTDLHSAPLGGIAVTLRNVATAAEIRTTTAKNGTYHFAALDAGEYIIEADSPELGSGHLDGIFVSPGREARIQAAIELEPMQLPPHPAAAPQETPAPQITLVTPRMQPAPQKIETQHAAEPVTSSSRVPAPELTIPASPDYQIGHTPAPQLAELTPQSSAAHPTLSVATPHASAIAPALAASTSAARGVQSILRVSAPRFLPTVAAAQRPGPASLAVTTAVSADEVQSLPVSGRRWQQFLLDTPTSASTAGSSQGSLRGSSQQSADLTVDGLSTRLAFGSAAVAAPRTQDSGPPGQLGSRQSGYGQAWGGGRGFSISEAAIREVQTVAGNVEAEGASASGGRVSIETARGGDQLHGQGFFFDRQNNWGARNPFTQWVQNSGSAMAPVFNPTPYTPNDHETVWGIGVGAPVLRNKLFWFAALDSSHRNDPGLSMVKYPSEFFFLPTPNDAQIQLLSAQLGESESQAYNDYLGVAASGYAPAGLEQLAGLLGPAPRTAAQWTGFARFDWQAAERHRFTLEGVGTHSDSPGGGLSRVSETYGSHSFGSSVASQQWLLARWEAYLTPNLLATTQASAGRDILTAHPDAPSPFEQTLLTGNVWGQLPQIVVDSRYGFTIGNPSRFGQGSYPDEHLYHAQESVDWVHNSLLVRAGFEIDHNNDATTLLRNQTGTYYYSKVQNFISDALAFEKFGLSNALDYNNPHNCEPAQLRRHRHHIWGHALLLLLLANHGADQLAAQHHRLGGLHHRAVAGRQARRSFRRHALGARSTAAAAGRSCQS